MATSYPVNILLGPDGSLAGVLDLGAWRIAHPWLDVAWWGWVVRTFHPEAWTAAWPSMLASAGVPSDDASARTSTRSRSSAASSGPRRATTR